MNRTRGSNYEAVFFRPLPAINQRALFRRNLTLHSSFVLPSKNLKCTPK